MGGTRTVCPAQDGRLLNEASPKFGMRPVKHDPCPVGSLPNKQIRSNYL
jgi:hypothetical protein